MKKQFSIKRQQANRPIRKPFRGKIPFHRLPDFFKRHINRVRGLASR